MKAVFILIISGTCIAQGQVSDSLQSIGGGGGFYDATSGRRPENRSLAEVSIDSPRVIPINPNNEAALRRFYEMNADSFAIVEGEFYEKKRFSEWNGEVRILPAPVGYGFTLGQHLGNGLYLEAGNEKVIDVGDPGLAEGTRLLGITSDAGIYSYVTVLGAKRQIQRVKLSQPKPASYEDFVNAVKSGYAFKTTKPETVKEVCKLCKGTKIQPQKSGSHERALCKECAGQGTKQKTVKLAAVFQAPEK